LRREFIRFIFSKEGQEVVVRDGYFPVPETIAKETRAKFGLK
jgi:phosphate transport system substrate-binding protein